MSRLHEKPREGMRKQDQVSHDSASRKFAFLREIKTGADLTFMGGALKVERIRDPLLTVVFFFGRFWRLLECSKVCRRLAEIAGGCRIPQGSTGNVDFFVFLGVLEVVEVAGDLW